MCVYVSLPGSLPLVQSIYYVSTGMCVCIMCSPMALTTLGSIFTTIDHLYSVRLEESMGC